MAELQINCKCPAREGKKGATSCSYGKNRTSCAVKVLPAAIVYHTTPSLILIMVNNFHLIWY